MRMMSQKSQQLISSLPTLLMAVSDAAHPTGQCAQISRNVSTNTQKFTLLEYTMHGVHARSQQNYRRSTELQKHTQGGLTQPHKLHRYEQMSQQISMLGKFTQEFPAKMNNSETDVLTHMTRNAISRETQRKSIPKQIAFYKNNQSLRFLQKSAKALKNR